MLTFFSISRSPLGEAGEKLFVGQLRTIELHLNLNPVHPDVTRHPEGDGVFDPGLGSPPLGQLPLEVLALVVVRVSGQQALSSNQLSVLAQLGTVLAGQLNPDFGEPATLGARTVELEELAQLVKAQLDGVQAVLVQEAQGVHMGGTLRAVVIAHLGHGHRGQPLSLSSPVLYTRRRSLSMSFLLTLLQKSQLSVTEVLQKSKQMRQPADISRNTFVTFVILL